jgi:TonB family protein
MYCSHCGTTLHDQARFCQTCGTAVQPMAAHGRPSRNVWITRASLLLIAMGCFFLLVEALPEPSQPGAGGAVQPLKIPATPSSAGVAGRIGPPTKTKNVAPVYPRSAQSARTQGTVVVEATIGPDGKVASARVTKSIPQLDQAALDAVRQWEYTPTLVDGKPVPVTMTVSVDFTLK